MYLVRLSVLYVVPFCCECGNEPSGSINGGISRVAEKLSASQEGLGSMEFVGFMDATTPMSQS